jgi:PAS domain S-box-containing protein
MDFKQVFESTPEAMVVIGPDMRILAATNRYLEVTMSNREDILGKIFLLEAFPEPSISYEDNPVRKSLERVMSTKSKEWLDVLRYDLARPDGSGYDIRFWEASHTPVIDDKGELLYIIQETKDVTDRENAKQALYDSEQRFRFMADAMPQLIDANDNAGNSTYFNKQWETYTGISVDQLLAGKWAETIHPDDLPAAIENWDKALLKGETTQTEIRIRNASGDYRWYLSRYLPMYNETGELQMWIGSCSDIHEIKNMVTELLASNEQMSALSDQLAIAYQRAENERQTMERLIMKAPAFFCILEGPEHRYKLVNERYQELFPHKELLNKTVAEVLPEVVEQGFIKILDNVYNTGVDFVAEDVFIKLEDASGVLQDNYVSFIYQALFDEHHKVHGILVSGYNVTEKFMLKQKLEEAEAKLLNK